MPELDVKEKLGPLPVWAWGVGVAAVSIGVYFLFGRKSTSAATPGASTLDSMGYQTSGISGGTATYTPPTAETNTGWITRVSRLVADKNAASPSDVYAALYKYVTGQDLTTVEKKYVDAGINLGMSPPEGVQGIGTVIPDPVNAVAAHYTRSIASTNGAIYNNGSWVSAEQYGAAGNPAVTNLNSAGRAITGYLKNITGQGIYAVDATGAKELLTAAQYARLGAPEYTIGKV